MAYAYRILQYLEQGQQVLHMGMHLPETRGHVYVAGLALAIEVDVLEQLASQLHFIRCTMPSPSPLPFSWLIYLGCK